MSKKISGNNNIFFDIDGTMVLYGDNKGKEVITLNYYGQPRHLVGHKGHKEFLIASKKRGFNIFLWSNNGEDWAEECGKKLGIDDYVDYYLCKPAKMVDDEDVKKWIKTIYIPEDN